MSRVNQYLNPIVAGICLSCTSLLSSALYNVAPSQISSSLGVQYFLISAPLVLIGVTLVIHMYGYVQLGRDLQKRLLSQSARMVVGGIFIFISSVLFPLFTVFRKPTAVDMEFSNMLIGMSITVLAIPSLLFAIAILRLFPKQGFVTIAAASIVPTMVISLWNPWPTIPLALLSTWMLYKVRNDAVL